MIDYLRSDVGLDLAHRFDTFKEWIVDGSLERNRAIEKQMQRRSSANVPGIQAAQMVG